jgi:hypothetical protein
MNNAGLGQKRRDMAVLPASPVHVVAVSGHRHLPATVVVQPVKGCLDDCVLPCGDVSGSQPDPLVDGELVVGQVFAG